VQLGQIPRIPVAHLPTPLEEMVALRRTLACEPRLFIKRDDCTGLATGGNKARKLEFLMADAVAMRSDTVLTTGGAQSNHARMTAAFARKLGIKPILVFDDEEPSRRQGNLLLDTILGAEVIFAGEGADTLTIMQSMADELRSRGKRPYVIPLGGSTSLGALGYVNAMVELTAQANSMGVAFSDIFVASGSGGTQAGMLLGARSMDDGVIIHGVGVAESATELPAKIIEIMEGAKQFGFSTCVDPADVLMHKEQIGAGYGIPTSSCKEAIRLLARTEGILLDQVYTGKAMAYFIDDVRSGKYRKDQNVLFWHTGGSSGLFGDEEHFQA
jgi:L-cysteate sulfo-lyase